MIERLVALAIRNRLLVIFGVLLVGAIGLRAAQQLPMDAVPDVALRAAALYCCRSAAL